MPARPLVPPRRPRMTRWVIGIAVVIVVLAAYAIALRWVTLRVEQDVQKSFRTAPGFEDSAPPPR